MVYITKQDLITVIVRVTEQDIETVRKKEEKKVYQLTSRRTKHLKRKNSTHKFSAKQDVIGII